MDNKQDRQFYWEVKDFLGNNNQSNSSKVSKPESLKECISKTIIKNDALYRPSIIPPAPLTEDIISSVNSLLSLNENHIKNNSNNITSNMFNLTEAPAPAFGGGSLSGGPGRSFDSSRRPGSGSSWRDRNPEEYQQNVEMRLAKQREAEENRRQVATDSRRRRAEDETYQYGQAMKDAGEDAQLEMDSQKPGIAADTAANRAKLQSWRDEKDREKRATSITKTIETVSGKDPSSLTAKEAAELQMAKIYMGGGQYSKGDPSLEGRVREKLGNSTYNNGVLSNKQQALQGPTPDGGNVVDSFATPDAAMKSTLGRSTEDLAQTTQNAMSREAEAKRKEDRAFADKVKEDRYQSMKDKVVQGTNMTYGEFEAKTGRRFNATDARDSSLISNLAGAGSRGRSETAKQLDLTTDAFNARYDAQNKDLAQKGGDLTRQMDKSQFELDKFQNNSDYRKQVRDAETAKLMPQVQAQVAADEAKRVATETADKKEATRIAREKTWADTFKFDAPRFLSAPDTYGIKRSVQDFVSRPEDEDNKPFLPTPTGDDNAANAAARSDIRNKERYNKEVETQKRLDAERENSQRASKAPNEYVSLINSFTAPKVGRTPIEPGSKENIDDQLKKLNRGQ